MSNDSMDDVTLSMTVFVNEEQNKVLYAVVDNHFADILLSFFTLPLGRILRILNKHYGDEAPSIGSLSSLYRSIANLDASHFVTEGAKHTLLNPTSTFDDEYKRLKLDITDSPPAEYIYYCGLKTCKLRSVSAYYDDTECIHGYVPLIYKNVVDEKSEGAASSSSDGVFTKHEAFFIISDDLHILPNNSPLLRIGNFLGITDTDEPSTTMKLDLGFSELMSLLRASLTSPTPLSDVILEKNTKTEEYSAIIDSQLELFNQSSENQEDSEEICLKVLVDRHTGKVLYAKCEEDFVEFPLSFLFAPLGGVEHILSGKSCVKAIDNFYRSTELIGDHLFKNLDTKNRLMKPNLVHGCVSKDHILPLSEESLPDYYSKCELEYSTKFPKGQGSYFKGTQTYYHVTDDLTVEPFCMVSIISDLRRQFLGPYSVKEVELQIGLKEGLSILKASLTSTSVLTHALKTHKYKEEPNPSFCNFLSASLYF